MTLTQKEKKETIVTEKGRNRGIMLAESARIIQPATNYLCKKISKGIILGLSMTSHMEKNMYIRW